MRSGKIVALFVVLVWSYAALAVIVNPSYTVPAIPANPVMPFLGADVVGLLWPLVLLSAPFALLAAQQLVRSGGGTRSVTPRDFARVQARARATRERIREDTRQSGSRSSRTAQGGAAATARAEPMALPTNDERKLLAAEELLRPAPKTPEAEFTPPPVAERAKKSQDMQGEAETEEEAEKGTLLEHLEASSQGEKEADTDKRIEELEAERGAMASLMDRLEDMRKNGTIQPELYDKLKKKYVSELEKINAKVERLPVNEELKKKTSKK